MVDAFMCGVMGGFVAMLLGIVALVLAMLSLLAMPFVLGNDRAARLSLRILGEEEEGDFVPPKHRFLFVFDVCWVVGVAASVRLGCPESRGAVAAGVTAALAFHALGRSPFYFFLSPTLLVVPSVLAGGVAAIGR